MHLTKQLVNLYNRWDPDFWRQRLKSIGLKIDDPTDDYSYQLDLLPLPYIGSLDDARVYILMLNPAWSESTARHERVCKGLIIDTLCQREQSFFPITQKCYLSRYWTNIWKPVIEEVGPQFLADRVCLLNLVPFRSKHYKHYKPLMNEAPVMIMKQFARELPNDRLIIVARRKHDWAIDEAPNVITFQGTESRGIHLHKYADRIAEHALSD
jgi:hypothetical protein